MNNLLLADYRVYHKPQDLLLTRKKLANYNQIAEITNYYRCNPIRFMEDILGIYLQDSQKYVIQMAWNTPQVLLNCTRGYGKALDLNTRIPTPYGDKKMRDIHVGDYVFGSDGKPTKVINESPIFYNHDCYKVVFSDGEEIIADADHVWTVIKYGKHRNITTREMSKDVRRWRDRIDESKSGWEYMYKVDVPSSVEYTHKDLPIHPYILGLWLGNGNKTAGLIHTWSEDVEEVSRHISECGYYVKSVTKDSGGNTKLLVRRNDGTPLSKLLRQLGVYNNKHIPEEYLQGDVEQRLELLRGLMDTDGTISPQGAAYFIQSDDHKTIADGCRFLVESLGMKCTVYHKMKSCEGKKFPCQELYFVPDKTMPVFKMERKYNRLCEKRHANATHKSIYEVVKVTSVPTKCIMVDSADHLYLCGEHNTVTHNSSIIDAFIMTKTMLYPSYGAYIASGTGGQAQQTFQTLINIAQKNINSMASLTDVFSKELEIRNATGDGFIRNPEGYQYNLQNKSFCKTLNSNVDRRRGKENKYN